MEVSLKVLDDNERLERIKPVIKAAMVAGLQHEYDLEAGTILIQIPEYGAVTDVFKSRTRSPKP